jgi:hypothetical protein
MYQYTNADAEHIRMLDQQKQDEERLRRILCERDAQESEYEERVSMLKAFIRTERDKVPADNTLITAAGLALFALHLTRNHPAIAAFNMHFEQFYVHPVPDSIIFFDAHGREYETIELGPNPTPLGGDVYSFLAGIDLNGLANYADRTLYLDTLNAWYPGK